MHSVPGYWKKRAGGLSGSHTSEPVGSGSAPIPPQGVFLSFEEWNEQLAKIMRAYNSEGQGAGTRIIPGMSPDEAFEKFWPADPGKEPASLAPRPGICWPTFRSPWSAVQVESPLKLEGALSVFDRQTGERQGQRLIAWFNRTPRRAARLPMNAAAMRLRLRVTPCSGLWC